MTQFEAGDRGRLRRPGRAPGSRRRVIEAGLGGRLDATNTIPSRVTVLTSVGLDHTEWLGETEVEIARREAGGAARPARPWCSGGSARRSRRWPSETAAERGARLVLRARGPRRRACGCGRRARFQRRNFALAAAAAEAFLGAARPRGASPRSPPSCRSPAGSSGSPSEPPTYLDAAHNPDGAAGPGRGAAGGRRRAARSSPASAILADKDAEAMVAALAPALDARRLHRAPRRGAARRTARPGARPQPAAELAGVCATARGGGRGRAGLRRGAARGRRELAARAPAASSLVPAPTTCSALPARPGADCATIRPWIARRRLRTAVDDGAGRRGGRRRDPRLLRHRLPVREAVPLSADRCSRQGSRAPTAK